MSVLKYRILVVSTFFELLFSLSVDFIWQRDMVEFVSDFSDSLLDASLLRNNLLITTFVAMLLTAAYSFIGLLRLQDYARYVFLVMFLFLIPIYLLLGVSVQSGLSRIFYDIGLLMSGVLLTITFTLPVKFYFRLKG